MSIGSFIFYEIVPKVLSQEKHLLKTNIKTKPTDDFHLYIRHYSERERNRSKKSLVGRVAATSGGRKAKSPPTLDFTIFLEPKRTVIRWSNVWAMCLRTPPAKFLQFCQRPIISENETFIYPICNTPIQEDILRRLSRARNPNIFGKAYSIFLNTWRSRQSSRWVDILCLGIFPRYNLVTVVFVVHSANEVALQWSFTRTLLRYCLLAYQMSPEMFCFKKEENRFRKYLLHLIRNWTNMSVSHA